MTNNSNSNNNNNKLPPLSLACIDNGVADHPDTSETKSKVVSSLIDGFAIGDANEAFIEDGGEENNFAKITPPDGEKNFPSAIPDHCKFYNQNYESYENGYDSDGKLVCFDEYTEMGEDPDMFFEDSQPLPCIDHLV